MLNNNPFDQFNHVYVVHLKSNVERNKHIQKEFKRVGIETYELFEATPWASKDVLDIMLSGQVIKYPPCFRCGNNNCNCANNVLIRHQIANWVSFLNVFNDIVKNNYDFCLVCEDDVKFSKNSLNVISTLLTQNKYNEYRMDFSKPLLIRMGYPGYIPEIHDIQIEPEYTNEIQMSNSCFALNKHMALCILNSLKQITHTSDVYIHETMPKSGVQHYTMKPPPCFDLSQSRIMLSDIHPKRISQDDIQRERNHVKNITNLVGCSYVFNGNFGDLIGPYIFNKLTGIIPTVFPINNEVTRDNLNSNHYLIAGSTLKHTTKYSLLWGIGIMDKSDPELIKLKTSAENVYAVRGAYTMKGLQEAGILSDTDKVALGDPALLMPLLYKPSIRKTFKFGVIPHCTEYDVVAPEYTNENTQIIRLSDISNSKDIENVIKQIISCNKIITSSLHGLIVAHAYLIPAVWCNFTDVTMNGAMGTNHLKFQDYFSSLHMQELNPFQGIHPPEDIPESMYSLPETTKLIDAQKDLLSSCPFNLYSLSILEAEYIRNKLA